MSNFPAVAIAALVIALFLAQAHAQDQDYEALPYGDLEYMAGARDGTQAWCVWARVGEAPVSLSRWSVGKDNPASGSACVKAEGAKGVDEEFVIAGEGSGGEIVGSIKLRTEGGNAQAKVRLSWFNRLTRVDETRTFELTTDWQSYKVSTRADVGGPLELAVIPVGEATIWADDFSIRCPGPPGNENVADPTAVPHKPVTLLPLQEYAGEAKGREGSVELTLSFPTDEEPVLPYVWGGIPFPKGELYDRRCLRVVAAQGNAVPAQFDVLSRWHGDDSIQALLVTVPGRPQAGPTGKLRLEYSNDPQEPAPDAIEVVGLAKAVDVNTRALGLTILDDGPLVDMALLTEREGNLGPERSALDCIEAAVVGLDGEQIAAGATDWVVVERAGPLTAVVSKRQHFGPLTVESRIAAFLNSRRVLVSLCLINEGERCVVRDLGLRLIPPGEGFVSVTHGRKAKDLTEGGGTGGTGGIATVEGAETTIGVAIRDCHENRCAFEATKEAALAWAWWHEYRPAGVVLSQGLARTLDVMIDFDAKELPLAYSTRSLPLLTAPAEWYCNSGVFNFLLPPDPATFPIFEERLGNLETLGRFSWEQKERQAGRSEAQPLQGWFNFGDAPGEVLRVGFIQTAPQHGVNRRARMGVGGGDQHPVAADHQEDHQRQERVEPAHHAHLGVGEGVVGALAVPAV